MSELKKKDETEKEKEVIIDAEVVEQVNEAKEENNVQSDYSYKNVNKKNKSNAVFLILLVVLVVGAFWAVIFFIGKEENKLQSDSNKNDVELTYTKTSQSTGEGIKLTDVSDVVQNVMPSIVAITSKTLVTSGRYGPGYFGSEQYATGAGSGIIVSKTSNELMILTNRHVIEDAESLSVQFINDKSVDATVKGSSTSKDIAIITVPLKSLDSETLSSIKIATMGDSTKLKVGNGVIAIGNALGYGQSVTTGVVSALNRKVSIDNVSTNMIQIDAAINGGNSGGALLNSKGEVVGINSAKYSSSDLSSASIEGMGFAIPISDVSDLIVQLMNGETLSEDERGYLGVSGYMITEDYSEAYGLPEGFYVSSIVKDSGADKAKIEIGNIIVEIEGRKVTQFSDISEVLETKKAKDKVTLKIKYIDGREYKEKKISVTLSSYKQVN